MKSKKSYIAHVREKDKEIQTIAAHLIGTARYSKIFADKIGFGDYGEVCGLLHDIGKYREFFQNYIKSRTGLLSEKDADFIKENFEGKGGDHSTAGAQYIWKFLETKIKDNSVIQILSLSIATHHGLMDCILPDGKEDSFSNRMKKDISYEEILSHIDNKILERINKIISKKNFLKPLTRLLEKILKSPSNPIRSFQYGMLYRFLLSCLIDADRIDTIDFEHPNNEILRDPKKKMSWENLIRRFEERYNLFLEKNESTKINKIRTQISNACLRASTRKKQIFTLSVPTGGGKTLASLRWALHHAEKYNMDRIIYVIPYTSIIDQNADEAKKYLENKYINNKYTISAVLEHHSNLTEDERSWKSRILSQNWDSPVVFITMVQFLDALFGFSSQSIRRMHQISNSIIIFDEIQTLPVRLVYMFNNAINFFVKYCKSSVMLCTATQPLLNSGYIDKTIGRMDYSNKSAIIKNVERLFNKLKRVEIFDKRKSESWSQEEIVDLAISNTMEHGSCLVVLNTKNYTQSLYEICRERFKNDTSIGIYHLSTRMCPEHRADKFKEMRERLENNEKTICFSTQLIEAGVDISFGSAIRSLAGLDSIAQTGGRVNRHNEYKKLCPVYIINTNPDEEKKNSLRDIRIGGETSARVLNEFKSDPNMRNEEILNSITIERYFYYYFFKREPDMRYSCNHQNIQNRNDSVYELLSLNRESVINYKREHGEKTPQILLKQSFRTAATIFKPLDEETSGVIVPYGERGRELIRELYKESDSLKQYLLLKKAQRFSVNIYGTSESGDFNRLINEGVIIPLITTDRKVDVWYLDEAYYDNEIGLTENPIFDFEPIFKVEDNII